MKPIIIPDYLRYTDFTLEERLTIADIAWARVSSLTTLRILKIQRKQLIVSEADDRLIESYDNRICHLEWVIASLDESIREIYAEHGRIN